MRKIVPVVVLLGLSAAAVTAMVSAADKAPRPANRTPDCVYVGTPQDVVAKMVELAELRPGDLVCDPGCGDGRLVTAAARRRGCRGIGYEIDPKLADEARAIARQRKVDRLVTIEEQDIFTVDYSKADAILAYLLPDMITRLAPAFDKMKPGSRIVAHDYGMADIVPERAVTMISNEDNVTHTLYVYRVPLKHEEEK